MWANPLLIDEFPEKGDAAQFTLLFEKKTNRKINSFNQAIKMVILIEFEELFYLKMVKHRTKLFLGMTHYHHQLYIE